MLAINGIYSNPYRYRGMYVNIKSEQPKQPKAENNLNFTGKGKIVSYASAGILSALALFGISSKYGDVYLTYTDTPGHVPQDTIKMENGCSFEVIHTKYLMHKGKLWAYDKDKKEWRKTPDNVMVIRTSQAEDLWDVARIYDEGAGKYVLSKEDIINAQKNKQDLEFKDMLCCGYRSLNSKDNTLSIDVGYFDYHDYTLKFKYDDDKDLEDKN